MSANECRLTVHGRYILNDRLIDCPQCDTDRGLTFTAPAGGNNVTGSCPNQHVWDEHRVPAFCIREAVAEAQRRSGESS